ncbi:MAG: type II toxin-antitoxin system VapC family toxin [Solirubrobacteraceae bacterium]
MRFLLDTNVFLWLQTDPKRLGCKQELLLDAASDLFVSVASAWEIAIKYSLGRLPLPDDPTRYVPAHVRAIDAVSLAIEQSHAVAVASLPRLHGDPFDRMLVVQAQIERMAVVTGDARIAQYDVEAILV